MTVISGGKENLRANFIRENFKGHHGTYTISKSLRHHLSYRNSLGLERNAAEFLSFYPASDATLKVDPGERRPSTHRTVPGRTRALSFAVSAGGEGGGVPIARPSKPRAPQSPVPAALSRPLSRPHWEFWGTWDRCAGPDPAPAACQRARCHPTRPCDRCPPPPGCRTPLSRYIHVFSICLVFQKISCGEQGATRAEELRPFS